MKLNFLSKLALCMVAIVSLASCDLEDDVNNNYTPLVPDTAFGIIANASPNSGDLYFYADANLINNSALNFGSANGYYNFYTGDRVLTLKNDAGTTLATSNITLTAGQYFSAFAVNTFEDIELVTYQDSLEYPAANHAYVRFINLSPDSEGVTVATTSQNFATGLEFKAATDFIDVTSGTYAFTFTDPATGEVLFTTPTYDLYPGAIYTIYTKGFVTPPTGSNDTFSTELLRNY